MRPRRRLCAAALLLAASALPGCGGETAGAGPATPAPIVPSPTTEAPATTVRDEIHAELEARAQERYPALRKELVAAYEQTTGRARALNAEGVAAAAEVPLREVHAALEAAGRYARGGAWRDANVEIERGLQRIQDAASALAALRERGTAEEHAAVASTAVVARPAPADRTRPRSPTTSTRGRQQAAAPSAEDIYRRLAPAVVAIEIRDDRQRKLGEGSGFFVSDDGKIVTNHHVMEDAQVAVATMYDGTKLPVKRVLAMLPHMDLALIQVDMKGIDCLKIAPGGMPAVGSSVFTIGNPRGLEGSLSRGLVSGHRRMASGTPVVQMTAPISPGSSGGPVLSEDGRVVGVTFATLRDAQSINLAVAASAVRSLLRGPHAAYALEPPGQQPNLYAAILWSRSKGSYTYAYDALSKIKAVHQARRTLGAGDDVVAAWTRNGWCAIAFGNDAGAWGAGSGATRAEAELQALRACAKRTTGCSVALAVPADASLR